MDATRHAIRLLNHLKNLGTSGGFDDLDPLQFANFVEKRKRGNGFCQLRGEPPSVHYTCSALDACRREPLRSVLDYLRRQMIVDYVGVSEFLRDRMNEDGGYGFDKGLVSNVFDTARAVFSLRFLRELSPNPDLGAEGELLRVLTQAVVAHMDEKTGQGYWYRPRRGARVPARV